MTIRIVLLTQDPQIKQGLTAQFEKGPSDVELVVTSTFHEMYQQLYAKECSGLLIDFIVRMRSDPADRQLLQHCLDIFPHLIVRWDPYQHRISTLGNYPLEQFVRNECETYLPRKLRQEKRIDHHLHLQIAPSPHLFEGVGPLKTVTQNVSTHGLFVIEMVQWERDQRVWLKINELSDQTNLIQAKVIWSRPWGMGNALPGIGVHFLEITPAQKAELHTKTGLG